MLVGGVSMKFRLPTTGIKVGMYIFRTLESYENSSGIFADFTGKETSWMTGAQSR